MRWADWLDKWSMRSLSIRTPFLEMQWAPQDADKAAAWEMYIELLTRVSSQPLADHAGSERAALASIHSLFATTREVLRRHGRDAGEFTKIAIVVLNQLIRPFTTKWHAIDLEGGLADAAQRAAFRAELAPLREKLTRYTRMLADMAGVEDLTQLDALEGSP
jgi:hypothetical protein